MSCSDPIYIVKGNLVTIPITLRLDVLSFSFTCTGIVTPPSVGDIYIKTISNLINGETTLTAQFVVTSISGSIITLQSLLSSNVDDNGATIISSSGVLSQSSGVGDATLTYTSFTTDNYVDTNGKTIKMRILREVVDSPAIDDIIDEKNAIITAKGTGFFQFTVSETSSYPVGDFYGVIEIFTSSTNILEQRDSDVFPVIIDKNKI